MFFDSAGAVAPQGTTGYTTVISTEPQEEYTVGPSTPTPAQLKQMRQQRPRKPPIRQLKAMERKRWAFPIVGVAAARTGGTTRIALAGVAPIPWLLDGSLDDASPLPRNAYKVDIAKALVKRAEAALGQAA